MDRDLIAYALLLFVFVGIAYSAWNMLFNTRDRRLSRSRRKRKVK